MSLTVPMLDIFKISDICDLDNIVSHVKRKERTTKIISIPYS